MARCLAVLDKPPVPYVKNKKYCLLLSHKKYRGNFEIIALLLEAVKNNCSTMFPIARYTRTNYKQLKKYLSDLTEIGLIEINSENGRRLYRATEKGSNFLRQYYVLLGLLFDKVERQAEYFLANASILHSPESSADSACPI
jgi:predicted transcriptional regulator